MKCLNDVFGRPTHGLHARPLGQNDGPQPLDGPVELVIDHDVLVARKFADLAARGVEAFPDLDFCILAAPAQPLLQNLR